MHNMFVFSDLRPWWSIGQHFMRFHVFPWRRRHIKVRPQQNLSNVKDWFKNLCFGFSYRGTFAWIYARDWIVQMHFLLFYSIKVNYCCYSAYFVLFCFNKALTHHLRAMYILNCSFDADWRQNKGLCGMPLSHSALIKINCIPGKSPLAVFSPDAGS